MSIFMSIFQKPNRHQVIVTTCVLIWIFIVNVASIALGVTGWPLYFVTIFFFALGADMKNVPSIFAGGTLGLIAALGLHAGTFGLAPSLGLLGAFSVSIAIVLAVIILGGTVCPVACNNVAFAYLTVATVNFEAMPSSWAARWRRPPSATRSPQPALLRPRPRPKKNRCKKVMSPAQRFAALEEL